MARKYDAAANQFIYTWKTLKSWAGTCRLVYVAFSDDTVQTAEFKLK